MDPKRDWPKEPIDDVEDEYPWPPEPMDDQNLAGRPTANTTVDILYRQTGFYKRLRQVKSL